MALDDLFVVYLVGLLLFVVLLLIAVVWLFLLGGFGQHRGPMGAHAALLFLVMIILYSVLASDAAVTQRSDEVEVQYGRYAGYIAAGLLLAVVASDYLWHEIVIGHATVWIEAVGFTALLFAVLSTHGRRWYWYPVALGLLLFNLMNMFWGAHLRSVFGGLWRTVIAILLLVAANGALPLWALLAKPLAHVIDSLLVQEIVFLVIDVVAFAATPIYMIVTRRPPTMQTVQHRDPAEKQD